MLSPLVNPWQTPPVRSVGERLREAIRAANLDQSAVAAAVGVHRKTVEKWISGQHDGPRDPQVRARLTDVLGVDVYASEGTPFRRIEEVSDQEFVAELARRLQQRRAGSASTGQFIVTDAAAYRDEFDDPAGGPDEGDSTAQA